MVRSVQPVLIEVDREVEEAAASLGRRQLDDFRRVVLPALAPAILGGAGLAFARAIGEYGSVVLIGGNIPRDTQVVSQHIQQQIEIDRPVNAAAESVALLAVAFVALLGSALLRRTQRAQGELTRGSGDAISRFTQLSLRTIALGYLLIAARRPAGDDPVAHFRQRDRRVHASRSPRRPRFRR